MMSPTELKFLEILFHVLRLCCDSSGHEFTFFLAGGHIIA